MEKFLEESAGKRGRELLALLRVKLLEFNSSYTMVPGFEKQAFQKLDMLYSQFAEVRGSSPWSLYCDQGI